MKDHGELASPRPAEAAAPGSAVPSLRALGRCPGRNASEEDRPSHGKAHRYYAPMAGAKVSRTDHWQRALRRHGASVPRGARAPRGLCLPRGLQMEAPFSLALRVLVVPLLAAYYDATATESTLQATPRRLVPPPHCSRPQAQFGLPAPSLVAAHL